MAKTELVVLKLQLDDKGVVTNINQVNKALVAAGTSAKIAQKGFASMESAAGIAGSTVTEFGRLISDLPYGIQGIANNLSQLGSMFSLLVVEAGKMNNNLSTSKNVINLLKKQILGPVGILVAFQGLIALLEVFSKSQSKADREVQNFNESVFLQTEALDMLQERLDQNNGNLEEQLRQLSALALANKDYRKILENENLTISEKVRIGEVLLQQQRAINIARENLAKSQALVNKNQDKGTISDEQLAAAKEKLSQATKKNTNFGSQLATQMDSVDEATKSQARATIDLYNAQQDLAIQSELIINLEKAKQNLLETGQPYVKGSIDDIKNQIKELEAQRDAFATTNEQIDFYNDKIDLLTSKLNRLIDGPPLKAENILPEGGIVENLAGVLVKDIKGKEGIKIIQSTISEQLFDAIDPEAMQKDLEQRFAERGAKLDLDRLLGLSEQAKKIGEKAELVKNVAGALNDVLSAQADREIAIEKNKTTALNDQLKARLANENLSAEERDKINQQISRNEAKLVERQNKIAKKQFQREKALKIVMTLADTASSASKAYLSQFLPIPDPSSPARGLVAAGLATAFGLAQVAALSRLKYTEQGMPTPALVSQGGGGSAAPQAPSFNVVGASQRNQLAEAVSSALSDKPVKAYVVSSDVSSAQELDRRIVEGASI